ncbi:MAG: trigger factor [Oscillospiraceae bacterium]|jgi:trigger factor|nr:trigger factor [Oscillospiraceae bacterium]MDE6900088.1 trigger factor [Oscillospiraceae bacterium]
MSVKSCEKLEKSTVALTVEVSAADFEAAVEKAYRKQRGSIRMPGFRPGKAPRKMIENMYGAGVFYEEAVNIALPDAYSGAVKESELHVVGYPQVELLEVGKEGFSFKATVAVYPEVTLGQYKGVEAPRAEVNVTGEDVDARLKEMAERDSRMVSVEDRPVENGDIVNIDFEGFLNGEPFDGGKSDSFDLEIGSGSFVPGFEEQLVGMNAGEEKDIDITFPEDYHADLAGKAVVFHVKANSIKVRELPALDDEFAKDVSEFDTLDELKNDVREKLVKEREDAARRAFEDIVMSKVAEGIQADIPDAMVEDQAQRFVDNFRMQIQSQGIPYDQYMKMTGMDEEKLLADAKGPALGQVRMELAINAIVKAENLEASDEDVEAEYAKMASQYNMDVENVKKYMDDAVVREQVVRTKAIDLAVASAVAVKPEDIKTEEPKAEEPAAEEPKPEKPKRTRKKKAEPKPEEGSAAEDAQ